MSPWMWIRWRCCRSFGTEGNEGAVGGEGEKCGIGILPMVLGIFMGRDAHATGMR